MKKAAVIVTGFFLLAGPALAGGVRVGARGSYFSSENSIFRDIYGGAAKFGLEGGYDISSSFSIWIGLDYLHRTGKLTLTQEKTQISLLPLSLGVRYEIPAGDKFLFQLGAGLQEVFFKEDSPIGAVKENALGLMVKGGALYQLNEKLGAGLFLSWSSCKMSREGVDFRVGGLDLGAAVEFRF